MLTSNITVLPLSVDTPGLLAPGAVWSGRCEAELATPPVTQWAWYLGGQLLQGEAGQRLELTVGDHDNC